MPASTSTFVRRPARTAPIRVALIGLGTVGGAVARQLAGEAYEQRLRLVRVCARTAARPRPSWLPPHVGWTCRFDDLLASDVDVLVELVGGLSPARDWVTRALLAGKSVVTANKQLVAEDGDRLAALAARQHRQLRFGAAVAGVVPVIDAIRTGLSGDHLTRISGVLNGTCNYILTRMEEAGLPFDEALTEAQAQGFAEADPASDIEGLDARAKLAILCRVGFGERVEPAAIACQSIAGVSTAAFAAARSKGATIRQVSRAERLPGARHAIRASVGPDLVPLDSPLARIRGCENAILVTGQYGGDTLFAGRGAGGDATGVAVISDLLAIARSRSGGIQ